LNLSWTPCNGEVLGCVLMGQETHILLQMLVTLLWLQAGEGCLGKGRGGDSQGHGPRLQKPAVSTRAAPRVVLADPRTQHTYCWQEVVGNRALP
jgi:hypothetical protein